ncbi:hypothetical protein CY35_13G021700 [Sphagnum magellanicum]|jgi:hypothetical protein|nr:hypothetical protein CY35_13G021700 [Sphagnum magellanicum]
MAMRAAIVRTLRVNPPRSWDTLTWSGMRRGFSGKVLGEEERAAENIYIKKMEQEKLEKLIKQGFSAEEAKAAVSGSPTATPEAAKAAKEATASKASTDGNTNYAVIAGIVGVVGLAYWYFSSPSKKEVDNKE